MQGIEKELGESEMESTKEMDEEGRVSYDVYVEFQGRGIAIFAAMKVGKLD